MWMLEQMVNQMDGQRDDITKKIPLHPNNCTLDINVSGSNDRESLCRDGLKTRWLQ